MTSILERPLYPCVSNLNLTANLWRHSFLRYTERNWINIVNAAKIHKSSITISLSIPNPFGLYTVDMMDAIEKDHGLDVRKDILNKYSKALNLEAHNRPHSQCLIELKHVTGGLWRLRFNWWTILGVKDAYTIPIASTKLMIHLFETIKHKNGELTLAGFVNPSIYCRY